MRIDEIISEIEGDGPRSYYSFETLVHKLLKEHLENNNKKYEVNNEAMGFWDAIAPNGIEDINGVTFIEIKFNLSRIPPKIILEKILRHSYFENSKYKVENILFISAKPISEKWMKAFHEESTIFPQEIKLIIWGPSQLNSIINKNIKFTNKITNNLFALRLETAISETAKDWKKERDDIIIKIRSLYKRGQFSLFLGAGVSSSAGMPDWNRLLNSLFVSYLTNEFHDDVKIDDHDIQKIVSRLNDINEPSALMAARYLRKGLSQRNEESLNFINAVTRNLYNLRDKSIDINSELIQSIASVCLPKRTGAKIKSVVTYNFDDLLERQLNLKSIQHKCIYNDTENYDPDELPLYHVHGFLPEDRSKYDALDKSTLVFSEEGYHKIYSDSYHWSNLVQLNILRENNCLMIGLSMADPNLRRLLDIASKNIEQSKHFTFMQRLTIDRFCHTTNSNNPIDNIEAAKKFLASHHALNEEVMKELGVTVIWYENYEEIPKIIEQVSN